jgi:phosphoglycerol transferase
MEVFKKSSTWQEMLALSLAIVLCLFVLWFPMGVRESNFKVPFAYNGGDNFAYCVFMKGVVDGGWFLHNDLLGAPFGADLYDFPVNDNFSLAIVKLLSLFTKDYALIFNLFLLLNYPLTVLVTYLVFRHFKLSYATSIVGSLFYTFLPYHYSRAIGHSFYSVYYAIPLMTMVLLWVATGTLRGQDVLSRSGLRQNKGKWAVCLLTCFLLSSTGGFYYVFFGLFLLGTVALACVIRERTWYSLLVPGVIGTVILFVLTINVVPNLLFFSKFGRTEAVARTAADAEYGGLKISSLLLPSQQHVLNAFSTIKVNSLANPLTTENRDSTLGVWGSLGFLFLLGYLLFRPRETTARSFEYPFPLLNHLSILNLAAVLLATIGGFGSLFALLVWTQIRGYNRICVYIAFFAFFALCLLFDYGVQRWVSQRWQRIVSVSLLGCGLVLGLIDLLGTLNWRNSGELAETYFSDRDFVKSIEAQLPGQALIFQLPYAPFPESKGAYQMQDYDHLRGYYNSRRLRWSFGAMKGRPADLWQQSIAAQPVPEMLESLAKAGFSGLYVDRFGYEDQGQKIEAELASLLGPVTLVSRNQRLSFFNLTAFGQRLQERYTPTAWKAEQDEVLHPPLLLWEKGFYGLETLREESWRWSKTTATAKIINSSGQPKETIFAATFAALATGNLAIQSTLWQDTLRLTTTPTPYTKTLTIPPGEHLIRFQCDVPRTAVPNDARELIFRVTNATLKSAALKKAPESSPLSLTVTWAEGFYPEEKSGAERWHWGQSTATAKLTNPASEARRVLVETALAALSAGTLEIRSPFWADKVSVTTTPAPYAKIITVPPGEHVIRWQCNAPRTPIPNDDRTLIFRVNNFVLKPVP